MPATCEGCEAPLDPSWVACPHCGRPVSGQLGTEKLVRVITQVGVDLLEVGLLEAEANAKEKGDTTRAEQLAIARNLAKDVGPKIADAVTTLVYQKQVLGEPAAEKSLPPGNRGARAP
ncbi:MAG: hypothetical protein L3K16_00095 [Thermoplasmata archaeon]|nr:hypothetical protein [Thermoplasmata archaeon]